MEDKLRSILILHGMYGIENVDEAIKEILLLFGVSKSANTENKIKVDDPNAPWNWKKDISEL